MNHADAQHAQSDRRRDVDAVADAPDDLAWDSGDAALPSGDQDRPAAEARRPLRTLTLRTYLLIMALAVLVPMAGLGAFAIQQAVTEYQVAYQERLRATARLLSIALDTEIELHQTAIMALANSQLLDAPPGPELYAYAKQIGAGLGTWVTIHTPEKAVMNTRLPYGSPLPPQTRPWDAAQAATFHVTNILRGPGIKNPHVAAIGPVVRNGQVVATISIPFSAEQLGRRLAEGLFTGDGVLCLLDGDGIIIARTRRHEDFIGRRAPDWLLAAAASREGIGFGKLVDGGDVIAATAHPSAAPTWTVVVAQPVAGYYEEWFRPLMVLGGGGLVLLLALLLLLDRFSVWLIRPLRALTQNAKVVASGRRERLPAVLHTSRVDEFEALRVSLNEAAQVMEGRAEAIRVAFGTARRERNLLHSVVNGTSDPTFVKDAQGRIVLANVATLTLMGMPAAAVIGHVYPEPGMTGMGPKAAAEDRQVMTSGIPAMIERTIDADGDRLAFLGTKSPWRSASGEVLGVVVVIHDITEWKRSESRLRDIQAELIRTGRLSAMGAMANGLAHELNQPLAAITNYLGAARRLMAQVPGGLTNEVASPPAASSLGVASSAIEDACTQAMRAGEIVSRLRDFIGRGVAAMRIETIGDMIADACTLALPQETRMRVTLNVSIDPELEPVFVDRVQIQQVLVNLVLNAVQSMEQVARPVLTITAERDAAGDTRICVSDNGSGIPETIMAEMFEPFVSTRPDGLGMGLAIARMIVVAHGGTLAAANNPDGGATLTLVLPAVLSMEDADV